MRRFSVATFFLGLFLITGSAMATEEGRERPYYLAESSAGTAADKVSAVTAALTAQGFTIAGEYSPYAGAHIIAITDKDLQEQAAKSDFGGYGAVLRVSVTETNGQVQVSYTNPNWVANIYRMAGDLSGAADRLKSALGQEKGFGSGGGRTVRNLREYHYMMFMPYFDDQVKLAAYDSHQAAVDAVEAGLAAGNGNTAQVYRIDIAGKDEVLFGVALKGEKVADDTVMAIIDQSELRHTAHLPYEVLVSGDSVYMLHGKFRIAQSFPDLTMTTFMKISDVPDGIEAAMKVAVGGK